jgi:hypothetical protein
MQPHDGPVPVTHWNMLSEEIVDQAHALNKRVIAHVGENTGFERALKTGVDELSNMPCAAIDETLLQPAVDKGVTLITTINTLSSCVNTTTFNLKTAVEQKHKICKAYIL